MLVVDDLSNCRIQRVFAQIPGRAPGELAIGKLGDVGQLPQAEVAGVSEDDRVEVRQQILGAWLSTARMLKATGEAGPGVNFDKEIGEFQFGQSLGYLLLELFGALWRILAPHGTDRQVITDQPKLVIVGEPPVEALQHTITLGQSL